MRPAAHSLSFASPKESKQRKGDPAVCVPFAALRGNLRCSVTGRGCGTHCALAALRSDSRSQSELEACASCGAPARPAPCAPRRIQKGVETARTPTRAIALLGLGRGASGCEWGQAKRRPGSGCPHPVWMRLCRAGRGVAGVPQDAPASTLTRRGCLNEARKRAVSSAAHPAPCTTQVAPLAAGERGRRQSGRLSFGYFSLAKQRTSTSPARARPDPGKQTQNKTQKD